MSKAVSLKRNIASLNVLKTLKLLLENDYTMSELINELNDEENGVFFNHNVVSKYINTCRFCGIEILKIQNKYSVTCLPFGYNFTEKETSLFIEMQNIARSFLTNKPYKIFMNFVKNLEKFSNKHILRIEKKTSHIVQEVFYKAIEEKRKIKLVLKTNEQVECTPLSLTENKKSTFLNIKINEKEELINLNKVIGIELLNIKHNLNFYDKVVIFKLKDGLARRYTIRDNEQIIEANENEIVVSNKNENRLVLFSRLLRYDKSCEIISPKEYRSEMLEIVKNTIRNYEG